MRLFSHAVLPGFCLVLLLSACAGSPTVPAATVEYDHSYNFSGVRKIAIQPIPRDTVATMMISDQQISRIDQALIGALRGRGLEVVTVNAQADMFLSWKYVPAESADVSTFDPATQKISTATLYVNMIDPLSLQSVWRATFHTDLSGQPDSAEAVQYREEAAAAILDQFPPTAN
ncbi:MAG: DUF4136 domain-containing protein [Halioglobus sp.]